MGLSSAVKASLSLIAFFFCSWSTTSIGSTNVNSRTRGRGNGIGLEGELPKQTLPRRRREKKVCAIPSDGFVTG
jgi:hypothetical protein